MDYMQGATVLPRDEWQTTSTPGAGFKMPSKNPAVEASARNMTLRQFADMNDNQQDKVFTYLSSFNKPQQQQADPMANVRQLGYALADAYAVNPGEFKQSGAYTIGEGVQLPDGTYTNIARQNGKINDPYLRAAGMLDEKKEPSKKEEKKDLTVQLMVPTPVGLLPVNVNVSQLGDFLKNVPKTKPSGKKEKPKSSVKGVQQGIDLGMQPASANASASFGMPQGQYFWGGAYHGIPDPNVPVLDFSNRIDVGDVVNPNFGPGMRR